MYLTLALLTVAGASALSPQNASTVACQRIAADVSLSSHVYYPPDPEYKEGITNYGATNEAPAGCVVYPASAADVSKIIKVIGETRSPFAVKGGGHALRHLASSTNGGVLVAMKNINQTVYHKESNAVEVGAGAIWDNVFAQLEGTGVGVPGGRVQGIGVGGFTLGGGYAWRTNQYGLTVDNLLALELVLPQGEIIEVTANSHPELFWALKGTFNNFGIVIRFWYKAHPVPAKIWAGGRVYANNATEAVSRACSNFDLHNTDPKAAAICSYEVSINGTSASPGLASVQVFYDAPAPPNGPFDELAKIPCVSGDWMTQTFAGFVTSQEFDQLVGLRQYYHPAPAPHITPAVALALRQVVDDAVTEAKAHGAIAIGSAMEPFMNGFSRNARPAAYPHSTGELRPNNLMLVWEGAENDAYFQDLATRMSDAVWKAAIAESHNVTRILYPNYALASTPLDELYGGNVIRLQALVKKVDPQRVMTLAGGFKLQ